VEGLGPEAPEDVGEVVERGKISLKEKGVKPREKGGTFEEDEQKCKNNSFSGDERDEGLKESGTRSSGNLEKGGFRPF